MTRCRFVDDHRADHTVTKLCALVGLSRATFYRWANPTVSNRYWADAWLANEIFDIHRRSRRTYGSPRVWGQLRRRGIRVGQKRVARIMAECRLVGAHSRRRWRRGANTAPAGDLLERDFSAERSDLRWVGDITEFKCVDGKLFLAAIMDLHDRSTCGWSMGQRQTTDLVVNALVMALARRDPDDDLVSHQDRGAQAGFNWSSQHPVVEVLCGSSSASSRSGGSAEVEVAWPSEVPTPGRGRVLGRDRQGCAARRGFGCRRRGSGCWCSVVPSCWRHAALRHQQRALGPLSLFR